MPKRELVDLRSNEYLERTVRSRIGTNLVIGDDAAARAALSELMARLAAAETARDEAGRNPECPYHGSYAGLKP